MSRLNRIRPKIDNLQRCVRRMRDHWAESDDAARKALWREVHIANEELDDSIFLLDDEARRAGAPPEGK